MSFSALQSLCVGRFGGSAPRADLFAALGQMVSELNSAEVLCDLWLDGSYLTEKLDPDDIDLSLKLDADVAYGLNSAQQDLVGRIAQGDYDPRIDSYVLVSYPIGHSRRGTDLDRWPYWAEWWGIARGGWCKGVAVLRLGESDVGTRLAIR